MEPPTDTPSLLSQITNLQAELDLLRARYDTLLEAKNRAAERYKADYKKWRDFKKWLFRDIDADDQVKPFLKSDEFAAYTKASALGKRKQFEDLGPDVEDAPEDVHETKTPKQESICDAKANLSHSPPVAVASRHQRRKSYHGECSQKVLSLSPSRNKDPFLAPRSAIRDDKLPVMNDDSGRWALSRRMCCGLRTRFAEVPCKAESSRSVPLMGPRKRKGRYAQAACVLYG